jgi:hypothetical protein
LASTCNREISLNISIEDVTYQKIIINTTETIQASNKWGEISLNNGLKNQANTKLDFGTNLIAGLINLKLNQLSNN